MTRARRFVALAVASLLAAARAGAQSGATSDSRVERPLPARNTTVAAHGVPARDGDGETDPLVTEGAPRSFRVVSVPIPPEMLSAQGPIEYAVVSIGSMRILGTRQGSIRPDSSRRAVVFTIAIPSAAMARRVSVGYVAFSADGVNSVRVPVNLDITSVHRVTLSAKRDVVGVRPGERVTLGFILLNSGNADDTLAVGLQTPDGWSVRASPAKVIVPAGAQIEHDVAITIPPDVGTGSWFVDVIASRGAKEIARTQATLEVSPPMSTPVRVGPSISAAVTSVFSQDGMAGTVESFALDGPITSDVHLAARYSSPVPRDGITDRAVGQLGYSSRANSVALRAPTWGIGAGLTGLAAAELAGSGIFGEGASVALRPGRFSLQATAVTPVNVAADSTSQENVAVRADWAMPEGKLSISATHLRDAEVGVRQLDALVVGATGPLAGAAFSLEAGPRRYVDGTGFGALAEVRGNSANGDFTLRAMQAPGGSGAFAASRSGYFASGGHRIGSRLELAGSSWWTADDNATFSNLTSGGWALTPNFDLTRAVTIGADVHQSSYHSEGSLNDFGTATTWYGVHGGILNHWIQARSDFGWSRTDRDATAGGTLFRAITDRTTIQGQADLITGRGRFGMGTGFESSTSELAEVSHQVTLDLHVEQVAPFSRYPRFLFNASAQRLESDGVPGMLIARAGFEVPLGAGFQFRLDVDHSGIATAPGHPSGTIFSTRLQRSMGLPFIDRRSEHGMVYQDLNGNGRRDPEEPGFSGAIVRRGAESAMSDKDGEFHLSRDSRDAIELDPRTLPAGWIISPSSGTGRQTEFGLVPTAALEVRIASDSAGASTPFRFRAVTVALLDSAGRKWVVRTETNRALFDALPAGAYRIEAEASQTSEPLLIDVPKEIDVVAGRASRVTVTVRRRPVRIFRAGGASVPKPEEGRP